MSMIATLQSTSRPTLLLWTRVLVCLSVGVSVAMPFWSPLLVVGGFLMQAIWTARDHGDTWARLRGTTLTRGWLALFALIAYLAVRLLPPPISADALIGIGSMAAFAALVCATSALFEDQNDDVKTAMAQAFVAAFAVVALVHAIEVTTGFALRRLLWSWAPFLQPRTSKLTLDGDTVQGIVQYIANPTSAMLTALIWPVLLLARLAPWSRTQHTLIAASAVIAALAVFRSDHATSKMALVLGTLVWLAVTLQPRALRPLLAVGWLASCLLVLPMALYAYHHEGYRLPLNFSAQHRVVLWGVTAEKALANPVFGIGTGRTPEFDESTRPNVALVPGTTFPIATNRHAHNVFLQVWYEAGAVGALLLTLAGLSVIGWIARAPLQAQPLLAAAFAAAVMSASFSFSALASWFLASFAATVLFSRFALTLQPGSDAHP